MSPENKQFVKLMTTLALPIIATDILNAIVNWVDTLMIGSHLGINEITAVGIANQIFFLYLFIVFGVCSGSAIYFGQFWGKKDNAGIHKVMGICFIMSTFFALLFVSAVFLFSHQLLSLFSNDAVVIEIASNYIKSVCFCYIIVAFTVTISYALRFTGYVKLCLFTTGIAIFCNIVLNYVFIYIYEMSVVGAAYATLIARTLEIVLLVVLAYAKKTPIAGKFSSYCKASFKFFIEYFKVTSFVILNEIIWAAGTSSYIALYQNTGTAGQGAFQIANTAQQIFLTFGIGISSACGVMITNALGAGERTTAIKYAKKCMITSPCFTAVMSTILILIAPLVAYFYQVEASVKQDAIYTMYVIAFGMILKVINFSAIVSILRSGGDSLFCFVVDGLAVWFVGIPMVFLATYVLGLPIYIAVLFSFSEEAAKLLICLFRVRSNRWANCLVDEKQKISSC